MPQNVNKQGAEVEFDYERRVEGNLQRRRARGRLFQLMGGFELLVAQDREWIPTGEGNSLYLRPFMIATQRGLGVNHPSASYLFCVIASPAGAYFGASKAVKVWLSEDYTRAAPGGTGAVKCGGNYAAAFAAQQQAVDQGCDQVVWLDAAEHQWVEEMGGMNLYFVYGTGASARIVTPALTGTLLPGVTVKPMDSGASVPISMCPPRIGSSTCMTRLPSASAIGGWPGCDGMSLNRAMGAENSVPKTDL